MFFILKICMNFNMRNLLSVKTLKIKHMLKNLRTFSVLNYYPNYSSPKPINVYANYENIRKERSRLCNFKNVITRLKSWLYQLDMLK